MASRGWALLAGGAVLGFGAVGVAGLTAQPPDAAPKARYAMDVATTSGFMGGGNPLAMLRGGGGSVMHTLTLRLGSREAASGAPEADHFMPAGMRLGESVPLETPRAASAPQGMPDRDIPEQFRRPKGRLLLFWGCGAHAGPGQPVVIDFSKLAAGQMPPHLFSADVPADYGPTASNSRTFGEWPNGKAKKNTVPDGASLIGDHRVAGNYSPEMKFALAQDFMPGIEATSSPGADGAVDLSWRPVDAATGYYAWVMGAKGMGEDSADMVWWTSAARQEFGGGLTDWLPPATVRRLIGEKVVMPATQTSCTVPAEVKAAAGQMMMAQLFAYGPEVDFAYPPRPENPKTPWNPDWTARVRYRSNTSMMLGMPGMDAMMRGNIPSEDGDAQPEQQQQRKRKCRPSLGGLLKGKIGC
jgi:hypothetical protein